MPGPAIETPHLKDRKIARRRVILRGKIFYGENGAYSIDCQIRDITPKGARITVQKGLSMPSLVYLLDINGGMAYAAEVAWIKAPSFGLNFIRTHSMKTLTDPDLMYLQRCWAACKA